jgi:hypothetical protein
MQVKARVPIVIVAKICGLHGEPLLDDEAKKRLPFWRA